MDDREAVEILNQHITKFSRYPRYKQAVEVVMEATRKQIPKKWIDTKSYLCCPVCESVFDMPIAEKYCSNCGQRLEED